MLLRAEWFNSLCVELLNKQGAINLRINSLTFKKFSVALFGCLWMASLWGQVIPPNAPAPIYPVPTEYQLEWQQMYFMFGRYQPEHVLGY